MPKKKTIKKAQTLKRQGKSASTQASGFVKDEMDQIRKKLRTFTRAIPSFIMASKNPDEVTIDNIENTVSDEDFEKEPHRNKLNIIVTRTSHLSYHTGQLILLK